MSVRHEAAIGPRTIPNKPKRPVADLNLDKTMLRQWKANGPRDDDTPMLSNKVGKRLSRLGACAAGAAVRRRKVVRHDKDMFEVSECWACQAMPCTAGDLRSTSAERGFGRAFHRYQSGRDPELDLWMRLKERAETRVRYGYRRPHILQQREGWPPLVSILHMCLRGSA